MYSKLASSTKGLVIPFPVTSKLLQGGKSESLSAIRTQKATRLSKKGLSCSAQAMGTATAAPSTEWFQKTVTLQRPRGCHVVTRDLLKELPELSEFEVGMANFFCQHTSCSLTINENASPDVPLDLDDWLNKVAPEGTHYRHLDEGLDDIVSHLKSSMMGVSLNIPIQHGRLALGTWQGIYLNEHRNYGGGRRIVITLQGQKRSDGRKFSSYH